MQFSRNKISQNEAIHIIEKENYYNIINGYSTIFLQKDAAGNKIIPEVYIAGVEFKEVYALYEMDRELRNSLSKYLFIFEANIKSVLSNVFLKQYE